MGAVIPLFDVLLRSAVVGAKTRPLHEDLDLVKRVRGTGDVVHQTREDSLGVLDASLPDPQAGDDQLSVDAGGRTSRQGFNGRRGGSDVVKCEEHVCEARLVRFVLGGRHQRQKLLKCDALIVVVIGRAVCGRELGEGLDLRADRAAGSCALELACVVAQQLVVCAELAKADATCLPDEWPHRNGEVREQTFDLIDECGEILGRLPGHGVEEHGQRHGGNLKPEGDVVHVGPVQCPPEQGQGFARLTGVIRQVGVDQGQARSGVADGRIGLPAKSGRQGDRRASIVTSECDLDAVAYRPGFAVRRWMESLHPGVRAHRVFESGQAEEVVSDRLPMGPQA